MRCIRARRPAPRSSSSAPRTRRCASPANFALQREPRDLRVLLEAALATGDLRSAEPALRLIRESALEDVRLAPLLARLEQP